jgi:RNA polymerase sigma factor FliA
MVAERMVEADMNKRLTQALTLEQTTQERDRILLDQLPRVRYLARLIHMHLPRHVQLEDLVHAGVIGLIDALNKFDPAMHVQFSTYAKFRIRGAIVDSLRKMDWGPRELRRKQRMINEAQRKLCMALNREPTEDEIAAELNLELGVLQQLLSALNGLEVSSIDMEPNSGRELDDVLPSLSHAPESPLSQCLRSEMKDLLAKAVADLPQREQEVLTLYYCQDLTMKQVGTLLGIGESRVSQMHSAAVVALRARFADHHWNGTNFHHRET